MDSQQLSDREIDILKLVAQAKSNKDIAAELFISVNTVKVHLANIFQKIGVASRTEAALYAINHSITKADNSFEFEKPLLSFPNQTELVLSHDSPKNTFWKLVVLIFLVLLLLSAFLLIRSNFAVQPTKFPDSSSMTLIGQSWQILHPMSEPRAGMAVTAYNNSVYVFGGKSQTGVTSLCEKYDTIEKKWLKLENKPTAVTDIKAVTVGERIYVPGGETNQGTFTNVLEVYNPRTDTWELKSPLPESVSAYALAAVDGIIYLFGGHRGQGPLDIVISYDPNSDKWEYISKLNEPRTYAEAVSVKERIFLLGGLKGNMVLTLNESFNPYRNDQGESYWKTETPLPKPGYGLVAGELGSSIYVIYGDTLESDYNRPIYYSIVDDKWYGDLNPNYEQNNNPLTGGVIMDGQFFLVGGKRNEVFLSDLKSFRVVYTVILPITINR